MENTKKYNSLCFDWGEALVTSLTVVILIFVFAIRLIGVDGESMYPTLKHKDQLIISNLFYTPKYGDIVVLTKESFIDGPIVKRVIATEGQTIDYKDNKVWVDGVLLDEQYINRDDYAPIISDMPFPLVVPPDHVFVMGDNRNRSSDSRLSRLGTVHEKLILGRVLFRITPDFGLVK